MDAAVPSSHVPHNCFLKTVCLKDNNGRQVGFNNRFQTEGHTYIKLTDSTFSTQDFDTVTESSKFEQS